MVFGEYLDVRSQFFRSQISDLRYQMSDVRSAGGWTSKTKTRFMI
jgi:hypothetical protein